jgi:hypothetical protein
MILYDRVSATLFGALIHVFNKWISDSASERYDWRYIRVKKFNLVQVKEISVIIVVRSIYRIKLMKDHGIIMIYLSVYLQSIDLEIAESYRYLYGGR